MDGVMESDVEGWNSSGHDDNVSEMEEAEGTVKPKAVLSRKW